MFTINSTRKFDINFNYVSSVELLEVYDTNYFESYYDNSIIDKVQYWFKHYSVDDHYKKHYETYSSDYPFAVKVIMSNGNQHIISGYYAIKIAFYFNLISTDISTLDDELKQLHQQNLKVIKEYIGMDYCKLSKEQQEELDNKTIYPTINSVV